MVELGTPTQTGRARAHAVGAVLGVSVVLLLWGHTHLHEWLRVFAAQNPGRSALWAYSGLPAAMGVVAVAVVLAAPRLPMLPTVPAAMLAYGMLQAPFGPLPGRLPTLGPWQPRMTVFVGQTPTWDTTLVSVLFGVMSAAAIWGWWRPVPERRRATSPTSSE
jgi:hypothetical protein